jgi:hypothetical protein
MKNKALKCILLAVAAVFLCFIGMVVNAFFGNPVSKMLAGHTVKQYLASTYPGTDYYMESVNYNFKDSGYNAHIKSPSSIDTVFTVSTNMAGKFRYDSYSDDVPTGWNTWIRVDTAYRELCDTVLESSAFPYSSDIAFGSLEKMCWEDTFSDPDAHPVYMKDFVLDKDYDIRELGSQYGALCIYVQDDTVSVERAAEVLLGIRKEMDAAGIPFHTIDFVLQHPRSEDAARSDENVTAREFCYADIVEDGLVERVREANDAAIAYYAQEDAKKDAEIAAASALAQ